MLNRIEIATNGRIIPTKYVELLRSPKIKIRISDYGEVNSEKAKQLCTFLDKQGITYYYYSFVHNNAKWSTCGGIDMPWVEDSKAKEHFRNCDFKSCLTLEDGLFGKCSRAIHAKSIQGFEPKIGDYVDVYSESFRGDFISYMMDCNENTEFFMEACRFCNGTYYGETIEPAVQIRT